MFVGSDLTKYDVDTLVKVASGGQADISYTLAMEMTSELLMLEMVNRVSVCWFEVSVSLGAGDWPCFRIFETGSHRPCSALTGRARLSQAGLGSHRLGLGSHRPCLVSHRPGLGFHRPGLGSHRPGLGSRRLGLGSHRPGLVSQAGSRLSQARSRLSALKGQLSALTGQFLSIPDWTAGSPPLSPRRRHRGYSNYCLPRGGVSAPRHRTAFTNSPKYRRVFY